MKDKRLMPWWFVVIMILQLSLLSSVVQGYYIIGITDEMVYAGPALVASELGFWQKEGIDIRVEIIADREDMFRNMRMRFNLSGRHCVDFVGCRIGDGAYQRSMGLGIEPIAYVADSPGRIKLVTQEGVDSVARLKGKKVACDFDTANLLFLADTLQEAGLKIDDVDLFDLHGMNSPYLFLQGNVDAIVIDAAGAAQCVAAGGKIISVSQRSGGGTREALFAKGWLIDKEPELAAKFVNGFQEAQLWMNDPENTARLAEIINKKFYWRRYQADAEPLGETFVRSQLVGFEFRKSMKLDREFDEHMATADALFTERARAIRSGEILLPDAYEPTAKTGTALDDAWGWWRFTGSGDFYNYGTGGAALNVKTRGSDKRWDLYGISTADWFSPKRVWTFGGFLNDGYGWATDGVAKYLATTKLQTKAPAGQMGFALWLRCSNRNTTDTVLFSAGPGGKQAGFKILYRSKPAAAFEIVIGGVGGQRVFRLENVPASTFLDVCFSYDGTDCSEPVFQNVSLTAEPGQTVAILGATGSGKSTLVHLIPRFYDVTEGRVMLDGIDVRDISLQSLRSRIAVALQEAVLFSGTIRDNIRYGRPEATDAQVIAAAEAAQSHAFIMALPDGYDTMVGQRGVNLSGGQKQRLAIARALLVQPLVLILDDSTSAVDVETEAKIQAALRGLRNKCTSFVIAQRISTVLSADKIIVLDGGTVAAEGTHSQLIISSPIYQEIYESQLGNGVAYNG